MEFYEVVDRRRTIRDFASTPVVPDAIQRALEAGLKAPTYNHLREWDFVLVHEPAIRLQLVQAEGLSDEYDIEGLQHSFEGHDPLAANMYLDAIPKQKRMLLAAPELLVVVFKPKTPVVDSRRVYDLNCLASVWCCIENILLALAAEGLYGVTYIPQNTPGIKAALGIPEHLEVAALIPFGHQTGQPRIPPQKGVDLAQKLHFDQWGERQA